MHGYIKPDLRLLAIPQCFFQIRFAAETVLVRVGQFEGGASPGGRPFFAAQLERLCVSFECFERIDHATDVMLVHVVQFVARFGIAMFCSV